MSNVSAGDLAECIRGEPAFIGARCEVLYKGPTYLEVATDTLMPGWMVAFPEAMPWSDPNGIGDDREGWMPDAWLRRIPPDLEVIATATPEGVEVLTVEV